MFSYTVNVSKSTFGITAFHGNGVILLREHNIDVEGERARSYTFGIVSETQPKVVWSKENHTNYGAKSWAGAYVPRYNCHEFGIHVVPYPYMLMRNCTQAVYIHQQDRGFSWMVASTDTVENTVIFRKYKDLKTGVMRIATATYLHAGGNWIDVREKSRSRVIFQSPAHAKGYPDGTVYAIQRTSDLYGDLWILRPDGSRVVGSLPLCAACAVTDFAVSPNCDRLVVTFRSLSNFRRHTALYDISAPTLPVLLKEYTWPATHVCFMSSDMYALAVNGTDAKSQVREIYIIDAE